MIFYFMSFNEMQCCRTAQTIESNAALKSILAGIMGLWNVSIFRDLSHSENLVSTSPVGLETSLITVRTRSAGTRFDRWRIVVASNLDASLTKLIPP